MVSVYLVYQLCAFPYDGKPTHIRRVSALGETFAWIDINPCADQRYFTLDLLSDLFD